MIITFEDITISGNIVLLPNSKELEFGDGGNSYLGHRNFSASLSK
jgi:hypothetical protein